MKKKLSLVFLAVLVPALVFGYDFMVNNKVTEQGQTYNLFFDDLESGKIKFSLRPDGLKKAEISFDGGREWQEMAEDGEYLVNYYRPSGDEEIVPELMLTDEKGGISTFKPAITVRYQRRKPDEAVEQLLEKMKIYYEQENLDGFLSLFSFSYPDLIKFKEAIQNDFYNYRNMRLFYRIDSRNFDADFKGAVWSVYWKRKFEDRNGNVLTDTTAEIAMKFDNEGGLWLISGMRDNTLFGSSLGTDATSKPDLAISTSDISLSSVYDLGALTHKITINATVHNNGSASATNVKVKYYKKRITAPADADYVDISSDQTIPSIAGNSSYTMSAVVYDTGAGAAGVQYSIKVVVDPDNTIAEEDETDNSATKSVTTTF